MTEEKTQKLYGARAIAFYMDQVSVATVYRYIKDGLPVSRFRKRLVACTDKLDEWKDKRVV